MNRAINPMRVALPAILSVRFLCSPSAYAENSVPLGTSILQKACATNSGIKTAHLKIHSKLPEGWVEDSELWIERPSKLNFVTRVISPAGGEPIQTHILCADGKLTLWSSQPNPNQPGLKNVYMQQAAPPDVATADSLTRFGLAQFVLRLLTGEPHRLVQAHLSEGSQVESDSTIEQLSPTEIAVVSKDGNQQDELTFDPETGLLKSVLARAEDEVLATGEITYVSVNQPLEPGSLDWKLPPGARELKPPP